MMKLFHFLIIGLLAIGYSQASQAQMSLFDTKTVVNVSYSQADNQNGIIHIELKDGWHINANPASLDSLIPTTVKLISTNDKASIVTQYPQAHMLNTPLGDIQVYSGTVIIPVKLMNVDGLHDDKITVITQACDAGTCYPPATWDFVIKK